MGLFRFIFRTFFKKSSIDHAANRHGQREPPLDLSGLQSSRTNWAATIPRVQSAASEIFGPCWVIDGDTIVINKITIRLFGIDAPELDQPYGQKAKWALLNLCKGQVVHAVFDGSLSHDRTVAICYLPDGRDLSAEMVKRGMALDWPKYSGGKYRQFEDPGMRKVLWRADARQKGRFPPIPRV